MRAYIDNFLNTRYCKYSQKIKCGVPQGDPLSMHLFCLAINPLLEFFDENKIEFVAYADDIVVGIPPTESTQELIKKASREYEKLGLTINKDKCETTDDGKEVEFMG
jgi:hypothetical protein